MCKAVFFDIDGTLWDMHNQIPDSAVKGIHKLQKAGNLAFLCSGRTRAFIRERNLLDIGFDGIVAGCGTQIEDKAGKIQFYKELEPRQVEESLQILDKYHLPVVLEGKRYLYVDEKLFAEDPYGKKLKKELGENLRSIEAEMGKWEISKMSCTIAENSELEKAIQDMDSWYDALIHENDAVEFIPKGFSKASGIKKVCELYGINIEDTFAFGDSINDVEMLKYVNCGIAMGNSTAPALEVADYVTDSLHENGIYHALEHFELFSCTRNFLE